MPLPPLSRGLDTAVAYSGITHDFWGMCVRSVALSCLTLGDPMDCSPPASTVHGISPGRNTGVGCHFLLQGIFATQGSNLCLFHLHIGGRIL